MIARKLALLPVLALAPVASGNVITSSTGVYDENVVRTNTVDSSLTTLTVTQFTTLVATAFANDLGGVLTFDTINGGNNINIPETGFDVTYGVSQSKTLDILTPGGGSTAGGLGSANPISGAVIGTTTTNVAYSGSPGGGDSGVGPINFTFDVASMVTTVGLTYIGRSNGGTLDNTDIATITATFSNGTTSSVTTEANNATGERFAGFQAPTGSFVTGLSVTTGVTDRRVFIEDLGFVIVPEPASLGLLAMGGLLIASRRRA